jgi:hypothetical protein
VAALNAAVRPPSTAAPISGLGLKRLPEEDVQQADGGIQRSPAKSGRLRGQGPI